MASSPTLTPLAPDGFRRTPWKNGGGVTIDIADAYGEGVEPGSWRGMIWRLGRTSIVATGPFSDLTGYERLQTVIVGSGLVLDTPDGEIDLRQPLYVARYDGGVPIVSRLEDGPVEVVNLIADRNLVDIDLVAMQPGGDLVLAPAILVVYAPDGPVCGSVAGLPVAIEAGHALRIDTAEAVGLAITQGVAIVATIRLKG